MEICLSNQQALLEFIEKTWFVHASFMNLIEDFLIQSKLKSLEDVLDPPKRWFCHHASYPTQNEDVAVNDVLTPTVKSDDIEEIATSSNEEPVVQTEENSMGLPVVNPNHEDSKDSENQSILEASATTPEMYENSILESVVLETMDEADDEDSNNEY